VCFEQIVHLDLGCYPTHPTWANGFQAAAIFSGFHLIVTSIEKLEITGGPLMQRCKEGIGQKNEFDLFGSPIIRAF
jgi:hypothetical protein